MLKLIQKAITALAAWLERRTEEERSGLSVVQAAARIKAMNGLHALSPADSNLDEVMMTAHELLALGVDTKTVSKALRLYYRCQMLAGSLDDVYQLALQRATKVND